MQDRTAVEVKLGVLQAWIIGTIFFMLTLVISGVLLISYVLVHQRHEANNVLACYVEASVARSRKALPAITYYKKRPDQLKLAQKQIQDTLDSAYDAFGSCHK